MYQVIEQSHEEKIKMYMKLSKKELAIMLINANSCIESFTPLVEISKSKPFKFRSTIN